jgi:hypothetical protein
MHHAVTMGAVAANPDSPSSASISEERIFKLQTLDDLRILAVLLLLARTPALVGLAPPT